MGKKTNLDLVGKIFGRLTVVEKASSGKYGHVRWKCVCACGAEKTVTSSNLLRGSIKSCGCYIKEIMKQKEHQKGLGQGWEEKCEYCGKVFHCLSTKQTYCSDECSFLARAKPVDSGCIEWQGFIGAQGYGILRANIGQGRKIVQAHRYAWYRKNGEIPDGMCICHKCDNRKCVNVDHMFLGTWADNNKDRSLKCRSGSRIYSEEEKNRYSKIFRGEGNANSKLTDKEAMEIYKRTDKSYSQLAKEYGVSKPVVTSIKNRRSWKHIHENKT